MACACSARRSEPVAVVESRQALVTGELPPHVAQAFTWLASQQNGDGGHGGRPDSLATPLQSTAEVLLAQQAYQQTSGTEYTRALAALNQHSEQTAENLARKILVNVANGQPVGSLVSGLLARQRTNGGFGDQPGEDASVIDTAFALEALRAASHPSAQGSAVDFLRSQQLASGAWAEGANDGSVFLTASCLKALLPFRSSYAGVSAAVTSAEGYLLSKRGPDALWGEDFVSAAALLALAASAADVSVLASTESALRARQAADGSWVGDSFTTAIVLRALSALEARTTPSSPLTASISGVVLKANSTEAIAFATVSLLQLPDVSVQTNAEGHFLLPTVVPGTYTLTAHKPGYTSASTTVNAVSGQVTVAGPLVLDLEASHGMVRGLVFDSTSQSPLAAVIVNLTGPSTLTRTTAADGAFDFGAVEPGSYTLAFAKDGYRTLSGTAIVVAGQAMVVQLGMTVTGGFVDDAPGIISGRIIDGNSGLPLAGAIIELAPGLSATSAADGAFAVASVPRNTYQGVASAAGYRALSFTVVYPAGASGDLGTLSLFRQTSTVPPTTLTLRGVVVDGVSGAMIPQATVSVVEAGVSGTTGSDGRFELTGITVKSFHLAVSAAGYVPANYAVEVGAFGEANLTLKLSPPGGGTTTTTLVGLVTNTESSAPIGGAVVAIAGTPLSATTDETGHYALQGVDLLAFSIEGSAVGFRPTSRSVQLAAHGGYQLDLVLQPVAADSFQVVSVVPQQPSWPGNSTALFTTRVASLLAEAKSVLVLGEVQDATGTPLANILPYAEGTTQTIAQLEFAPGEERTLTMAWPTQQSPPAAYRLVVRVVEAGTITQTNPLGEVLAEGAAQTTLAPTRGIGGALAIDPPITQAGLPTEVSFAALLRNAGNVPLDAVTLVLDVSQPDATTPLFSTTAELPALAVGASVSVPFGTWVPTEPGDLIVHVFAGDATVPGEISGRLHVGDKATGVFSVDTEVVPDGTQVVRGQIDMRGVDTTLGSSTDPLFALVKESVKRGAAYTGPQAMAWHRTNGCLGCHIQTQSYLGLSSAMDKAEVDPKAVQFLYNTIATSQWSDGALRITNPEFANTQTTLGLWSLASGRQPESTLRAKIQAAKLLLAGKIRSGDQTRWQPDHASGWWDTAASHTALTLKGFAEVLRAASELDLSTIPDYSVVPQFPLGAGGIVEDMEFAPSGEIVIARNNGAIAKVDRSNGTVTTLATLPSGITGLGFATDGTLYVTRSSNPTLIRISSSGTRQDLSLGGSLTDVAVAADGWVYYSDVSSNQIRRRNTTGQVETFASGGLLNRPTGLVFDDAGALVVANQNGFNLLKIAPDRTVSIFADGLAYKPRKLSAAPGQPYFLTTFNGPVRVARDGTADRVLQDSSLRAVTVSADGQAYFSHDSTHAVQALAVGSLAGVDLTPLRDEVPFGVRYLLATHRDNSSDNTVHALRIWGLAESRTVVNDTAMQANIDAAISFETTLLRSRQRTDGGWGRFATSSSDPLSTAMVGIALEYTNPSPDDPQIRKAIQYLLNTQLADGSWNNRSNGLTTRLAATSFVMVFMPQALERLGGIDLDLYVDFPANITLSNPTVAPSSITAGAGNMTTYIWRLLGVTAGGQRVDFDLTLHDMLLNERRSVAQAAYLEFDNSFTAEKLRSPLTLPIVRAESQLRLALDTDKSVYLSDQQVLIGSTVRNTGLTPASGAVELAIRPAGSSDPLVTLPALPFGPIAPGQQVDLPSSWNTGTTLAGPYEVYGRLLDAAGRNAQEAFAPFRIDPPLEPAAASVTTDRPVYEAWDVVTITGRVRNLAPNAFMAPSRVELTVSTPSGQVLLSEARSVAQLAPRGIVDLTFTASLVDAQAGEYTVTMLLKDDFTRDLLDTATTSFSVERKAISALAGEVSVDETTVLRGAPNRCVDHAQLRSAGTASVALVHLLVNPEEGTILDEVREVVELVGGAQPHSHERQINTSDLAPGGYSCILSAEVDGVERTLDSASFEVVEPPIQVSATLNVSGPGRLLVLLDPGTGADPLGPAQAPALGVQRAALQEVLSEAGWSYTIVESADAFTAGLNSGTYSMYAIFAETQKLSTEAQQLLGEAVFRGEGLVFAGDHDSRDHQLHEALGVKYTGKHSEAQAVVPAGTIPPITGAVALLSEEKPLRVESTGAAMLGEYQLDDGGTSPAITLHTYGLGRAAWMGADLGAIIGRDGKTSIAAQGLRTLLEYAHPRDLHSGPRSTLPIELLVENLGSATQVSVAVELPAGSSVVNPGTGAVSGQTLQFEFSLAVGELERLRFWFRLPAATGPLVLRATVNAGETTTVFTRLVELPLLVSAPKTLPALSQELATLALSIPSAEIALKKAKKFVDSAIDTPAQSVKDVLAAVDALSDLTDARVVDVRVDLDLWLRATLAVAP